MCNFQVYHGEITLLLMRWWQCLFYTIDQYPYCWVSIVLDSLKQHSAGRHVALIGNIILTPGNPIFVLRLILHAYQRSSKYQFYKSLVDPTAGIEKHRPSAHETSTFTITSRDDFSIYKYFVDNLLVKSEVFAFNNNIRVSSLITSWQKHAFLDQNRFIP